MTILKLEKVNKSFSRGFVGKRMQVLKDLSLDVATGEVFGLLGHNGSGKTTTMRIVLGLLRADSGQVGLFGADGAGKKARSRIGYLSDEIGLYPHFNAAEMLQLIGELFRIQPGELKLRKERLLKTVGLYDRRGLKVKKYSKGMRQRLGIALALLNDPELLILDEPYSGLDPIGRRELRQILLSLKQEGKTILLSSHIVPDVEAVCDRVGILSGGHIQKCLALQDIYDQKSSTAEITVAGVDPRTFDGVSGEIERVTLNEQAMVMRCHGRDMIRRIVSKVYAFGGDVLEIKPLRFNLEDYLYEALTEANPETAKTLRPEVEEGEYAHSS